MNRLRSFVRDLPSRVRGAYGVLTQDPVAPSNVAAELAAWAAKEPRRTFLWFEDRRFTFGELADRVRLRANALAALGVRRGDTVPLMMGNSPEFLVNVWALARLGAVVSLINTSLTGSALAHALTQVPPRAVLGGREYLPSLREALELAGTDAPLCWEETRSGHGNESLQGTSELSLLDAEPNREAPLAVTLGDELFAYIFTSGTTGLPKAGKISHARARTAALGFGRFSLGLGPRDVLYVCLPLFHSSGLLIGAGSCLHIGATLALSRRLSVSRFWDDIADSGATSFVYIGEVCRYLVNAPAHPKERAHRLTRIVGNGMRPDVWEAFDKRFKPGLVHEFYAATEGNVNMTNVFGHQGSVGRMPPFPWLDNAFLARFDRDLEEPVRGPDGRCIPCQVDEPGELLGRIDASRATMRFDGYAGGEATNKKILRDVVQPNDAYFRSGDLLRKDRWGFYYFVDRIGDTFRFKGENVSTNEVADVCAKAQGVHLANVVGVVLPDVDGRAGLAALELLPQAHFSPQAFYEHVMAALPAYAAPLFVRLLVATDVTATFKLKKTELVEQGVDPTRTDDLLFFRDDKAKSYEPIDAEIYRQIASGERRF